MAGNEIASWCISPLGTCGDTETILTYEPLCGRNVTIYNKEDSVEWMKRGWSIEFASFEYPVNQDSYCKRVNELFDASGMIGEIMFARQIPNDREDVAPYDISQGVPEPGTRVDGSKEYWQMQYLTHY